MIATPETMVHDVTPEFQALIDYVTNDESRSHTAYEVERTLFRRLLGDTRRQRCLRLFRLGWLWLLVRAIRAQPVLVPQQLVPEPWPGHGTTNRGERAPHVGVMVKPPPKA
jgi:hypothetical protein